MMIDPRHIAANPDTHGAEPLLEVTNLSIATASGSRTLVDGVSFKVDHAQIVGIVGESGSGKTLSSKAVGQLLPSSVKVTSGRIRFLGRYLDELSPNEIRSYRGGQIGFVFQEPMTSLNPSMRIGRQLDEGLRLHFRYSAQQRRQIILDMLTKVGIRDPQDALDRYPYQFSGGMRQRIMIAGVMMLKPKLLIADEPTSALDAVVQAEILDLMMALSRAENTSVLMISHDMAMVGRYADRVLVMEQGKVVEDGETKILLERPQHPYTQKLLASLPLRTPAKTLPEQAPIVSCRDVQVNYGSKKAVDGVSIDIHPEEVVALVGASGSGKTTIGRVIAGLVNPDAGQMLFDGKAVDPRQRQDYRHYRLNCQMIFQDPFSSLDPRVSIGGSVAEALRAVPDLSKTEIRRRSCEALEDVGLGARFYDLLPHELSGGQKQRVAIARAIVRRPAFVVADEPVSALDLTIKAQVIRLLIDLQRQYRFACLFISHDLGVVEQIADRVVVMENGRIVEQGLRDAVFDTPQHAYTRRLLDAIPILTPNDWGGVSLGWRHKTPDLAMT